MEHAEVKKFFNGPGGLHARRRVHPRRVRGAGLLGRRGLLRARARRGGRHRQGHGGVDRRRPARVGPLAHGHPSLRPPVPLAALHARAHGRGVLDVLRHQVPGRGAQGRAAAARLARLRAALASWAQLRREVGLGTRQLVRPERRATATRRCARAAGRAELVARDRGRVPRGERARRADRPVLVREDRRPRARARAPSSTACAPTPSTARSDRSSTRSCSTAAGASRPTSRSCGSRVDRFLYVTGTAFGSHNLGLAAAAPAGRRLGLRRRHHVRRAPASASGARARATILQALTKTDLSHEAFPYMRAREIAVGSVPLLASRVTYVGELGLELYAPAEYGARALRRALTRPALRTACAAAATARSSRCGSRRAIAPGAPTSRPRPRRSRRAWASRCGSTRPRRSSARRRCAPSARPAGRPSGSRASCSTIRARSASAPSRCASPASCAVASRRAATAAACGAASRSRTCRAAHAVAGTRAEVEVFGEWVRGRGRGGRALRSGWRDASAS